MARGNFAGVRYELDELFKLSTMGRRPKAKKGSFASENAGFGLRKDTAELPGAGPEPAYSQTSTVTMNLPCAFAEWLVVILQALDANSTSYSN